MKRRKLISDIYIRGQGIEIGALYKPCPVMDGVKVRYVDRMSKEELIKIFPKYADSIIPVDIIDNGELLKKISDSSQDFVIASHFIEHCENPILTIQNMFRVLKENGILFLVIPDKNYSFDIFREKTTLEHLIQDYKSDGAYSKEKHFEEVIEKNRNIKKELKKEKIQEFYTKARDDRIHFHVWSTFEVLELFLYLRNMNYKFEVECFLKGLENFIVLRKTDEIVKLEGILNNLAVLDKNETMSKEEVYYEKIRLGMQLERLTQNDAAFFMFKEASELYPEKNEPYIMMSSVRLKQNNFKDACKIFEKVKRNQSENSQLKSLEKIIQKHLQEETLKSLKKH